LSGYSRIWIWMDSHEHIHQEFLTCIFGSQGYWYDEDGRILLCWVIGIMPIGMSCIRTWLGREQVTGSSLRYRRYDMGSSMSISPHISLSHLPIVSLSITFLLSGKLLWSVTSYLSWVEIKMWYSSIRTLFHESSFINSPAISWNSIRFMIIALVWRICSYHTTMDDGNLMKLPYLHGIVEW
jgi:hypothetical protein